MAAAFSRLPLPAVLVLIPVVLIIASLSQSHSLQTNGDHQDSLLDHQSLNISHLSPSNHRKSLLSHHRPRPSDNNNNNYTHHPRPSSIHRHRRLHSQPLNIRNHHDLNAHNHPGDHFPDPWVAGVVTWYGSPEGAGSDGGACGYKSTVSQPPFNSMIAAGSNAIYLSGQGCGACYKVKCKKAANKFCSGRSIKVVITDKAPEDSSGQAHFDLSGTAFGALACPGHAAELRNAGIFQVQYKRVSCGFKTSVTFRVDEGSNPYYMALLVEFQNGKRDITKVELRENDAKEWKQMTQSWGAMYQYNSVTGKPICFPLSVRVTETSGQTFKAMDVIPSGWDCSTSYTNHRNF